MNTSESGKRKIIQAKPLTAEAFAPFGDVIEMAGPSQIINQGFGQRYSDLAKMDLSLQDGRPAIHWVSCIPEKTPVTLRLMERHPLSSQLFMPLDGQRYLVVVAPAGQPPGADALHAFLAHGKQGVNYHRSVWHHPMIALDKTCDFLEVQRFGPGDNCDEVGIPTSVEIVLP